MKKIVTVGIAVGTLLLVVWLVARPAGAPSLGALSEPGDARGADEAAGWRCRFAPGARAAYRTSSGAAIEVRLTEAARSMLGKAGDAPLEQSSNRNAFQARLDLKVLRPAQAGGFLLAATFTGVTQSADGRLVDGASAQLEEPFLLRMRDSCAVTAFGFPASFNDETRRTLRGAILAHAFEVVPGESQWRAELPDTAGVASAELVSTGERSATMRRTHYVRAHVHEGKRSRLPKLLSSTHTLHFAEDGLWLESARGEDEVRVTAPEATVLAKQRHEVAKVPAGPDPFAGVTFADIEWTDARLAPPRPRAERQVSFDAKGLSADDVMARYLMILRAGGPSAQRRATLLLTDALKTQPSLAYDLERMLKAEAIDAALQAPLFLALEKAGTREAHEVLRSMMRDAEHSHASRLRAVAALSTAENPSAQDLNALAELSAAVAGTQEDEELKSSATYALGSWEEASRQGGDAKLAARARELIADGLGRAEALGEQAAMLDAIGNSGNVELADELAPFLESDEPLLKAHAVSAHRRMPLGQSAPFMADAMQDEAPQVRRAAVSTYLDQLHGQQEQVPSPAIVAAAIAILPVEESSTTRSLLIDLLGRVAASHQGAYQALLAQYQREPEVRLKIKIASFLDVRDI